MPCLLLAADTLTACLLTALHLGCEQRILVPDKRSHVPDRKREAHFWGWPPPTFLHMNPGGGISLGTNPLQEYTLPFAASPGVPAALLLLGQGMVAEELFLSLPAHSVPEFGVQRSFPDHGKGHLALHRVAHSSGWP